MSLRSRTLLHGQITGQVWDALQLYTVGASLGSSTCDDELSERMDRRDKVFLVNSTKRTGGIHTGATRPTSVINRTQFYDLPISDGQIASWMNTLPSLVEGETEGASALRAKAMTNPSRNEIQLPVFLFELKDIPGMIRHAGRLLHHLKKTGERVSTQAFHDWFAAGSIKNRVDGAVREAASAHLAYSFGWAPLVNDLKKMVLFADAVEQRKQELDRLISGTGLKRRVTLLRKANEVKISSTPSQVYLAALSVPVAMQGSILRWATMRWKPSRNPLAGSVPKTDQDVRNLIMGLNASSVAGHVWEALPWSWLVDYFYRVGDVVNASNNAVGAELVSSCIMTTKTRRCTTAAGKYDSSYMGVTYTCSVSALNYTVSSKKRHVTLPGVGDLQPRFGLLTDRQSSILGALAVMRISR